ncbi:MAG: MFS transporter [Clostridia bacterium]|nr:MFS transporter [Clostridia bacterium]
MAKEYLKDSMFDRPAWQTHVKTGRITTKERVLGHMIGPGLVYFFYSTLMSLRELFYMDILRINEVFGNPYTYLIMTTVTTIIGMLTGIGIAHITEKTVCRAGRFRPYVLLGTWIMSISGFFVFWSPFASGSIPHLIWLYVFNICFTAIGAPLWNLRSSVVSVISRNVLERNNITTIRSSVTVMIAGVLGAIGIVGFLYPNVLQKDLTGKSWFITIGGSALVALAFSFVEYFWTRERVTEDNQKVLTDENGDAAILVPFTQQFKNAVTNKYFLLSVLVFIGVTFYDSLQGGNARVNMISYILGGNAENNFQFTYLLAAMQPMAIGAVLVPILAKKISARKIMLVSSVITLIGIGIAMINPYSFVVAVAGGFVFACGIFAITNMYAVFQQQAYDDIEYKHGYRPEGTLATGIIFTLIGAVMTPLNAVYETGLTLNGYVAGAVQQPQGVNNWILFAYYGSYAVLAVIILIVCIFFDIDKRMPEIHAALRDRARKAAEDRGEVYVSPEEQDRLEKEAAAREIEEARIADLKARCEKKGLSFEEEEAKYQAKLAAQKAKAEARATKRRK